MNQAIARVQEALLKRGFTCEIKEFSESTRTANDAAVVIGCEVGQIVKSLLFKTTDSDQALLILVSGKNRVNERAIEALVKQKIVKADADYTREMTGFAIGGIPPLDNENISYVFIDKDLLLYETVWAAAGTPNAVFSLSSCEISKMTDGKIVAIK